MTAEIGKDAEQRMLKSIESLKSELARIRTGRAHASILDHVTVDYYGNEVPISQAASVTVEDSRTIMVAAWDKAMISKIEKAIMTSDLGLNPVTAGTVIRVPMPPLTEERRRDLVKVVRHEAENARVAIRNIRRDANNDLKHRLKEKEISEDEAHSGEDEAQRLTDRNIAEIDRLLAEKEKELLEI